MAVQTGHGAVARLSLPQGAAAVGVVEVPDDATSPRGAIGELDVDLTLAEALLPRESRGQVLALVVSIGGATLHPGWIVAGPRVTSRVQGEDEWQMTVGVYDSFRGGAWPVGSPWTLGGPPPGLAAVDVVALYVTATGVHRYPLLTNGIVDRMRLVQDPNGGGTVMEIRGMGPGGRHDGERVSLDLDPGHRLGRLAVARRLAIAAGIPSSVIDLPRGRALTAGVEVIDQSWRDTADQMAELEGVYLTWSADGDLVSVPRLPDESDAVAATLDLHDLVGSVDTEWPADIVTELTLTATQQVSAEECGLRTVQQVVEIFQPRVPQRAAWRIVSGGTLSSVSAPSGELPTLQLVRRIITDSTYLCDTLVAQRVRVYAYRNRSVWRYRLDDTGAITFHNVGAYVIEAEADTAGGGPELAWAWPVDRWVLESDEYTRHAHDDDGYLTRTTVERKGWRQLRAALKEHSTPALAWPDEPFASTASNLYVLGNGEAVANDLTVLGDREETFSDYGGGGGEGAQWLAREVTSYERDGAYLRAETVDHYAHHLPVGTQYYYLGDETSSASHEIWGQVSSQVTAYSETGEDTARAIRTAIDFVASPHGRTTEVAVEPLDSYLPEAPRLLDTSPDTSSLTEEEAEAAVEASQLETRELRVSCKSEQLEIAHRHRAEERRVEYVEDEADMESLCAQILAEGATVAVSTTLPLVAALRKGQQVRIYAPPAIPAILVRLMSVTSDDGGPGRPITTRLEGITNV